MGRLAALLGSADDKLKRVELANKLMFTTRGQPVTYYGDEQGFIGAGGDKDARQDMFATKVAQYQAEPLVGGGTMGSRDRYDTSVPLYGHIAALAKLRQANPALADGAQIHRYASSGAGIYAFSRIDRATGTEYVVAVNNAAKASSASFQTYSPNTRFAPLHGTSSEI